MWGGGQKETVNNVAGLKLAKERCVCGGGGGGTVNKVAGLKLAQKGVCVCVCVCVGGGGRGGTERGG